MSTKRTRRAVRIRRKGRHSSPSQVEKVALQAGKAAPAVAIAGALAAAPQAQQALAFAAQPVAATATVHQAPAGSTVNGTATTAQATLDSFETRTVAVASATPARHAAAARAVRYKVRGGDSLSAIASRYYHNAAAWQYLYHANDKTVTNPNLIFVGEELVIPASAPAHYTVTDYVPKHAKPARASVTLPREKTDVSTSARTASGRAATIGRTAGGGSAVIQRTAQGSYSCSGLEQIWEQAGGSSADAMMAAEIAMAESGGNPNAISPTDDFGLWQINASNGALATLNPFENARSAVIMSDDGANWNAWTTYHSGAFNGRC
jgi:LysM repeat protein